MTTLAMSVPSNPSTSIMNQPPLPLFLPALLPHPLMSLSLTLVLTLAPVPVPLQGGSLLQPDNNDKYFEEEGDTESLI